MMCRKLRVLFVINGVTYGASGGPGISGGDVMTIEIAKRWVQKGVEVSFLTSVAGRELCRKLGLKNVNYLISSSFCNRNVVSQFLLALKMTILNAKFLSSTNFNVVCSSCEHLYDVLPALKLRKKGVKWAATVHFVPPSPLERRKAGIINALLYFLNHMLGALIIRMYSDLIFAVSQRTALDYISKLRFDKNRIVTIPGGVDYNSIRAIASSVHEKVYDAVFMKRLHPMKGAFDVIKIWYLVTKVYPNAKLLIIGEGAQDTVMSMREMIKKLGLTKNIEMIGPIYNFKEKISLLAKSKLFLLPSYEENWAVVIGEALASGLPVIVYELPEIEYIWNDYVIWVPKGNIKVFAEKIIKLLSDKKYYQAYSNKGLVFMKQFDWNNISEKELKVIEILTKRTMFCLEKTPKLV
jgi:glycosyltransferase involved in cell wall biosynthesis